jgi:hypothetical protein
MRLCTHFFLEINKQNFFFLQLFFAQDGQAEMFAASKNGIFVMANE